MKLIPIFVLVLAAVSGCGGTTSKPAESASESGGVAPNKDKAVRHLEAHVHYPASRQEVLAACAKTPKFSSGEKQWISDHLPEGTYQSPGEVEKALGL